MNKVDVLSILGIVFMIISMLIMMNPKVALAVTIVLWLALTFLSLVSRFRNKARK